MNTNHFQDFRSYLLQAIIDILCMNQIIAMQVFIMDETHCHMNSTVETVQNFVCPFQCQ